MVSIVLASHGAFAAGIKESGSMIFGPQENVAAVVLTPDMGPDDMHQKLLDAIATFDDQEHVLFLVDLWGGTPFNQVSRLISEEGHDDWVAITGLNLPMLVSAYGSRMGADTARAVMEEVYPEARAGVKVKPEELQPADAAAPAAAATAAASTTSAHNIPPDFFCMIAVSQQKVKFLFQVASFDATLFFFACTVEREGNYGPENGRTGTAGTNP